MIRWWDLPVPVVVVTVRRRQGHVGWPCPSCYGNVRRGRCRRCVAPEAKARILAKARDSDRCRARAAVAAQTAMVG